MKSMSDKKADHPDDHFLCYDHAETHLAQTIDRYLDRHSHHGLAMKRFGYWRDPLFLACCTLYVLNRWWVKPHVHSPFLHGQFNDCLLIPCALPLVLWLQRRLGLRQHDGFPTSREVLFHLAVWSVLFELIGPHIMHVTGDLWDAVAYLAGGLMALGCWRWQAHRLSHET